MWIGSTFVGTSCVMSIFSDPSRIDLVECCNVSEERVMVAEIT
jgi:protein N-terminal amidase